MTGWRVRQMRAALTVGLHRGGPRLVSLVLALALAAASFAFASVRLYGGNALAATPTLITTASGTTEVGGQIFDNVNILGGTTPTGTVRFNLYGPDDPTCSTSIFQDDVTINGNGSYNSAPFTTTQAGTYRWVASYSGDANNDPVTSACNLPAETVVVSRADTVLQTNASDPVPLGGAIFDTASLTGGFNPTGTITFTLTGPDDQFCTGGAAFTSAVPVAGNGTYDSGTFTPTQPGLYRWQAVYSGDANNQGAGPTLCIDEAESVVVGDGSTSTTSTSTTSTSTTSTSTTSTIPTSTTSTIPTSTTSTSTTIPTSTTSTSVPTSSTSTSIPTTSSTTSPTSSTSSSVPATTSTTSAPTSSTVPSSTSSTAPTGSSTTSPTTPTTLPGGSTPSTTTPGSSTSTSTTSTTMPRVPTGTSTVPTRTPTVGVTPQTVPAGQNVTVFGSGFPPRSTLDIFLFSDPVLLGTTVADAAGSFRTTVTIPITTAPGDHRLVVVVRGGTVQAETRLTVTAPGAPAATAASPSPIVAPRGQLTRTGTDLAPARFGAALLVVGLLMVAGVGDAGRRRMGDGRTRFFQQPPSG